MSFGAIRLLNKIKGHAKTVTFSVRTHDAKGELYITKVVAEPIFSNDGKTIVERNVYMDIRRENSQYRQETNQIMTEERFQAWYFEFA